MRSMGFSRGGNVRPGSGRAGDKARRLALLAGTALVAGAPAAAETVRGAATTLTGAGETLVVVPFTFSLFPPASAVGIAPLTTGVGIDALGGNDDVTLQGGSSSVTARVSPSRTYSSLPGSGAAREAAFAAPLETVLAIGIDGGAGADRLVVAGPLTVAGVGDFTQKEFGIGAGLPGDFGGVSADARLLVGAVGMLGGSGEGDGANRLENRSLLVVGSTATGDRLDMNLDLVKLGGTAQNLTLRADSAGQRAGDHGDDLANVAGSAMLVSAGADGGSTRVAATGLEITGPSSATVADARAVGQQGGAGADRLANAGTILAGAEATLTLVDVGVTMNQLSLPEAVVPANRVESNASGTAIGMAGGGGTDALANSGTLSVNATVRQTAVDIAISDRVFDLSGITTLVDLPDAPAEPTGGATARIIGMAGDDATGAGNDRLDNAGRIAGTADAQITTADVSIAAPLNAMSGQGGDVATVLDAVSIGISNGASASALAFADGMSGGLGGDRLRHAGTIDIDARAHARTGQIAVDVLGFLDQGEGGTLPDFSLSFDAYNSSTLASARSRGLAGDGGSDQLETLKGSSTMVGADGKAENLDAGLSVSVNTDGQEFKLAGSAVFARLWAGADAVGMDGGAGADALLSAGELVADARATSNSLGVDADIGVQKGGMDLGASFLDTRQIAEASAAGIRARDHGDLVRAADIASTATATLDSIGVELAVRVSSESAGFVGDASMVASGQSAQAVARGIDRLTAEAAPGRGVGGSAPGMTAIADGARIKATASSDASRIGVSAGVTFSQKGAAFSATLLDQSLESVADAVAFEGGLQADRLTSGGQLNASAEAIGLATSTGVSVALAENGFTGAGSVLRSDATSSARAVAAGLGGGADTAALTRDLRADSSADLLHNVNSVAIAGARNGVGVGAALADMSTDVSAVARALDAGAGADSVTSAAGLDATAAAEGDVVLTGITLSGAYNGVAAGVVLARTQGEVSADATAAAMGEGDDLLDVAGALRADADSDVSTTGVGVSISASYQGVAASLAALDLSGGALARAAGADGGAGNDLLRAGSADVDATSEARGLGVTVSIGAAVYGVGAGGAAILGTTDADALAVALDGGAGADTLELRGNGTVDARAAASRTDVAVSGSFAIGVAVAGNFLDTTTTATSVARGLSGDGLPLPGGGADSLASRGKLTVNADADARGASYAFAIPIAPVGIGANLVTGEVLAVADAAGQEGGDGNDLMLAEGDVVTLSTSLAEAISLSLSIALGFNYGDLSTTARAVSAGLSGGQGDDRMTALGLVSANARAETKAKAIGISFTGGTVNELATLADARATALDGGDGHDSIVAARGFDVGAAATMRSRSVSTGLTGMGISDLSSQGVARAVGVAGGTGMDQIDVADLAKVRADSTVNVGSTNVSITGVAGGRSDSVAVAQAVAVDGGTGDDKVRLGLVDVDAVASASSTTVSVALVGAAGSLTGLGSRARGSGFDGGEGSDGLVLGGGSTGAPGTVNAAATTRAGITNVTLTGVSLDAPTTLAVGEADLAAGGAGNDSLAMELANRVEATATGTAGSTGFTGLGASFGRPGSAAEAHARGLAGDAGQDVLNTLAFLRVDASATAGLDLLGITLAGAGTVRGGVQATARAVGLDGGADDDRLYAGRWLETNADALAGFGSTSISGVAASVSRVDLAAVATAIGLSGGAGQDLLRAEDMVIARARAASSRAENSFALVGINLIDTGTRLAAVAIGLDGGDGDDLLDSRGTILADAGAGASSASMNIGIVNATMRDAATLTDATATGIAGGNGLDEIRNTGRVTASAAATARSSDLSGQLLGGGVADLSNRATAVATGIDGGADDDVAESSGDLVVTATANGRAQSMDLTLLGGSALQLQSLGTATSWGLLGGGGADWLLNRGSIELAATARLDAVAKSFAMAGFGASDFRLTARGAGTGLGGGDGDDQLLHTGTLIGRSTATLAMASSSIQILGGGVSAGLGRANAILFGLDGGAGSDRLISSGLVDLLATAAISSLSDTITGLGGNLSRADLKADAQATGLAGGEGTDLLEQGGKMTVKAASSSSFVASNLTILGLSAASGALGADATAFGLHGGNGGGTLRLIGAAPATVSASAATAMLSATRVGLGAAVGDGAVNARALAVGMEGGSGADAMALGTALTVSSLASLEFDSSQFAFAGANLGQATGLARSEAVGMFGGPGDDMLVTAAPLTVRAEAASRGSAAAGTALGATNLAALMRNDLFATGLGGGNGTDSFSVAGQLTVEANSLVDARAVINAGVLFSGGKSSASGRSLIDAAGVRSPGTASVVTLDAPISVTTRMSDYFTGAGVTRAVTRSVGASFGSTTEATAESRTSGLALLRGVMLGEGANSVVNRSEILVHSRTGMEANARADGNSTLGGFAYATSIAGLEGGTATVGIDARGQLTLDNAGTVRALATPHMMSIAFAGANGGGFTDPDGVAVARANADNVAATGVTAGSARIANSGLILADASPRIDRAHALGTRSGEGPNNIDGTGIAEAFANNATARGVHLTGASGSEVVNGATGVIDARANPYVHAFAQARGTGRDGDAFANAMATALNARAVGIEAGSGADRIENLGMVRVSASPQAVAVADAVKAGSGQEAELGFRSVDGAVAIGISAGAGDDHVVNRGVITTSIPTGWGIAIDAGAGNDLVEVVGPDSGSGAAELVGSLFLGGGNDELRLANKTRLTGVVDGGSGNDLLVATGGHQLESGAINIERLVKRGGDELRLATRAWNPAASTTIEGGVVSIQGGLTATGHDLRVSIYADGSNGRLQNQAGGSFRPRGSVTVLRDGGAYRGGQSWDVLRTAGTLDLGGLSAITLPTDTALVKFSRSLADGRALRVSATVHSMGTLADSAAVSAEAASLAAALDSANAAGPSGAVERAIGTLQQLPTELQVAGALDAMAPRTPTLAVAGAGQAMDNAAAVIAVRQGGLGLAAPAPAAAGLAIVGSAPAPVAGGAAASWAASFDRAPMAGFAPGGGTGRFAGIASGMDLAPRDDVRLGVAMLRQRSEGTLSGAAGGGRSESTLFAGYLQLAPAPDLTLSASIGAGNARFDGARATVGGGATQEARLRQRSRLLSLDARAEWALAEGPAWLNPALTGSFSVRRADAGSARETGGSGLGLLLDGGTLDRKEAMLGFRIAPSVPLWLGNMGRAQLSLGLGAGLVHRFGAGAARTTARFADMPDLRFELAGGSGPRDRLDWSAGAALQMQDGATVQLGWTSRGAGAEAARDLRAGLTVPF